MRSSDIVRLSIALLLAACGILVGNSYVYAYFLLFGALLLVGAVVVKRVRGRLPKIYYDQPSAFGAGSQIYKEAAKSGGRLIATHVKPKTLSPSEDIAIEHLKKVDKPLEYERFVFLEDKLLEDKWIKDTLVALDTKVQRSIHFIKRSLIIPSILWSVVPRANILLYNKGNYYTCLLGLDRLQTQDEQHKKTNFAIEFHSKRIFDVLHRYFVSMISHPCVENVKSMMQYTPKREELVIRPEIQSILADLSTFADCTKAVLHVGIFGRAGLLLNGLQKFQDWDEHELDVDIMVIVNRGGIDLVKQGLLESFRDKKDTEIIWGDDTEYFYHFRSKGKITIDIEIHERDSDFYKDHPLLGCSIFAHYHTLFRRDGGFLHEVLNVPSGCHCTEDRIDKLLNDRKGLKEFKKRLSGDSLEIDPRRILSIAVRNVSWAISGARPSETEVALEFLSPLWTEIFPSVSVEEIRDVLMCNIDDVKASYKRYRQLSKKVIEDAILFCEKSVPAPTRA